jgi:hypothetical protein
MVGMDEKRWARLGRASEVLLALVLVAGVFYVFRDRFWPLDTFTACVLVFIGVAVAVCHPKAIVH